MTHTLHRRGDRESLSQDYIVFTMSAKKLNEEGSAERMKKFLGILLAHRPVNYGDMVTGNRYVKSPEEILNNIQSTSIVHGVFTDEQDVIEILKELKEADLGMSVVVTGIHDETEKSCRQSGLAKHTVENSLGIFGQYKKLPPDEILQLTTMCGHGMVPANLVERMITQIKRGKKSLKEAALELTRPCHCGIYNPVRAENLLRRLLPLVTLDA
ncbi:MAG TPA: hypothetical protein VEU07_04145 [Candidatus Acidoferrum sp.]|nr:hypothetical protein [Candidatus Acidoferrum sp.]